MRASRITVVFATQDYFCGVSEDYLYSGLGLRMSVKDYAYRCSPQHGYVLGVISASVAGKPCMRWRWTPRAILPEQVLRLGRPQWVEVALIGAIKSAYDVYSRGSHDVTAGRTRINNNSEAS